jgi:hypothetical protein
VLAILSYDSYATFVLGCAFTVYIILLSKINFLTTKTNLWFSLVVLIALFTYQIDTQSASHVRAVTSIGDPNFSSYYLLLLFFLARKVGSSVLVFYTLTLGLLFLSKNFYLAIVVFYSALFFKKYIYNLLSKFNLKTGFCLLASHIILIVMALLFEGASANNAVSADGVSRLVNFSNSSDLIRLRINLYAVQEVFGNVGSFFNGVDLKSFRSIYTTIPHNALFFITLKSGVVFAIFYFSAVVYAINKKFSVENIPYIFSYMVFGLFLHTNYSLFGFVIFYYILSVKINGDSIWHNFLKMVVPKT